MSARPAPTSSCWACRPLGEAVRDTQIPGLSVMPANVQLAGAEIELIDIERREHRLEDALYAEGTMPASAGTPSWSTARPRSAW